MYKSFKTEIAPTKEQKTKILRSIGIARFLYNQYVAYNTRLYKMYRRGLLADNQKRFLSAMDFNKYVNHTLKKKLPWIDECGSKARKKVMVDAEHAFRNFFSGKSSYPKFKKKTNQDIQLYFNHNGKGDWRIWRHKITIPTFKQVRLKEYGYLPVGAYATNGKVSYKAGRFYVSVLIDIDENSKYNKDLKTSYSESTDGIGIDLGIKNLAIISDGKTYPNINKTYKIKRLKKRLKREMKRYSRKLTSKKSTSNNTKSNLNKQQIKMQKLYQRILNIRKDYENKVVHNIIKQKPRFITVEKLRIKNMIKNKHLAHAILEQRFCNFIQKLKCKAEIVGIEIRIVDAFYPSSKRCHCCGHIHKELKLKDRTYICPICGYKADRDYNASLNLRDAEKYQIA